MKELAMCRVCLAEDVRLRLIANTHLQEMYESLTLLPLETEDSRPIGACYICCAGLQNCYRLRKRCLRSEELLTNLLNSDVVQPLNVKEEHTQKLRVEHPVILLSIGDELQNNKVNEATEDSAHRTDAQDVCDHGTVQQQHNEDIIIKMEPEEYDARLEDDIQCSLLEDPLDIKKRKPNDVMTEPQEEYDVQLDVEYPLDVIKSEPDDVETDDENIKLEIEDTILEEKDPNVVGCSLLADNICPKAVEIVWQGIDVKDSTKGARVSKKVKSAAPKDTEDATTNKRKIKVEKNEETDDKTIKEPKKTRVKKPVTTSKILKACDKLDFRLNKCENVVTSIVCEENSTNNTSIENNVSDVSISKNNLFTCDICKKSFHQKNNLIYHNRIHTGEKPYECNFCKKCFIQKCDLNKHIRKHTGERPYECNFCKKGFIQKNDLKKHIRIHTNEKPYVCTLCKKCFSQNIGLKNHMRTHTGERPFECTICKKCFTRKGVLQRHIRTHTCEKPYQCHVCQKCFIEKSNLNRHMITHTGKKSKKCL